jgi:hypothetical protein
MSPFVDAVVAPYSSCSITHGGGESEIIVVADGAPSPTAQPLIGVREAVSRASQDIRLSFCSTSSVEAKMITQMRWPASCYRKQASWIWSIIQEVRAHLLPSTELEVDDGPWWGAQIQVVGCCKLVHQFAVGQLRYSVSDCRTICSKIPWVCAYN